MLKNPKEIYEKKKKENGALGHFNVNNLEMVKAITKAAENKDRPVFVALTETALSYGGFEYLVNLVKTAGKITRTDIFLHLDHGKSLKTIEKCVKAGFNSIMFDGSSLPFKENVKETNKVSQMIADKDISLEAELGHVGRHGDETEILTESEDVETFVKKTDIDSLAVAVGTIHGSVKNMQLDYKRLKKISDITDKPIVIHGGSGLSDKQIKKLIECGANKFNFDSDIRLAFMEGFKRHTDETDPRRPLTAAMKEIQRVVEEKIDVVYA